MNLIKYVVSLLFLVEFMFSCKNQSARITSKVIDSLVYQVNMIDARCGIVGDSLMYFANIPTLKQIRMFHIYGHPVDTIYLNQVVKKGRISDIYFTEPGRVALLSYHTNIFYQIDYQGNILDSVYLNPGGNDLWEFYGSSSAYLPDGTFFLYGAWRDLKDRKQNMTDNELIKYFYYNLWRKPLMVKVSGVFSKNRSLKYEWCSATYQQLIPDDPINFISSAPTFSFQKDSIFLIQISIPIRFLPFLC